MLSGLALALRELPLEMIDRYGRSRRICDRGGEREVQFLFADAERLLPGWRGGRREVLRWGNRRGESARLPCTAWTQADTVEKGGWRESGVERVVIPATMGLDKGVWYRVRQGIRGLLARDEDGRPLVLCLRAGQPLLPDHDEGKPMDAGADRRADLKGVPPRITSFAPGCLGMT
jgi:hypothetical protein